MTGLIISATCFALLLALACPLLLLGLRSGDRPDDVAVTATAGTAAQPDGRWPVIVVTVRNPGSAPVLVGLSARRRWTPAWLDGGHAVSAPVRTRRRRFRAGRHDLVGVVGPAEAGRWQVPAPAGRHCRLVAVVGQPGRLRVIGVTLGPMARPAPAARGASLTLTDHDG